MKKIVSAMIPIKLRKQLRNFRILAVEYGQYQSIKNWDCLDKSGKKIPWYTYPTIEYLNNIDFSDKSVFEYGSGNSSIYWANRAKEVISLEHDREWYEKISSSINKNHEILFKSNSTEYEKAIQITNKKFDVIIIDGIRRVECSRVIHQSLNKQSDEGFLIVLDNSDWYKETARYLRESLDLIEIDFHGFGPINNYTWTTSVFLSRNFKFKAVENIQPHYSVAAIEQTSE